MAAQSKFISGHTHLISLIGNPIRHSKSPVTHSVSFEKLGIDAVYLAFNITPEDLPDVLAAMRRMDGWDGSNVTMPCKQAIIPYLDGLSDAAELMGAVNVLQKTEDGKLIGHNTDGAGFWENLKKNGVEAEGKTVTVTGPGGAGSAIWVQGALNGAAKIHIFARQDGPSYKHTLELLDAVVAKTGCDVQLHPFEDKEAMKAAIAESDILANATNVGMGADNTESPVPAEFIKDGMVVADAIYFPLMTQLLQDAEAKGCQVITGIGMMNEQAAVGEKIWYGVDMPIDEVTAELNA
ncbi:MAG: shikimate dehydrogenase [Coriobacteriia bacterium]|nr:shikimate dehydrogenase [Coriobacteriia bacterium]